MTRFLIALVAAAALLSGCAPTATPVAQPTEPEPTSTAVVIVVTATPEPAGADAIVTAASLNVRGGPGTN